MTSLNLLLEKLNCQTANQAVHDGFPSMELRKRILEEIKYLKLGKRPQGTYLNANYSDMAKLKIEYLQAAGTIGATQATQYIADKITLPAEHFLRPIINAGMDAIGRTIGRSYASEIYPVLRNRRLNGEKDPELPRNQPIPPTTYGFTVDSDRDIYDLSAIHPMTGKPGSHVYYDEICDRHTETFVFASIEDADAAHWSWKRFIRHQTARPPVKYAIKIETDSMDEVSISTVLHADPFEKSRSELTPEGTAVKWEIRNSLTEAETLRQQKLNERKKDADKNTAAIVPPEPDKAQVPAHEKERAKDIPSNAPGKNENKKRTISK